VVALMAGAVASTMYFTTADSSLKPAPLVAAALTQTGPLGAITFIS